MTASNKILGHGGNAVVREGTVVPSEEGSSSSSPPGTPLAIKQFRSRGDSPARNEFSLLRMLSHPNILRAISWDGSKTSNFKDDNNIFTFTPSIALELMRGGDLCSLLAQWSLEGKQRGLPAPLSARIFLSIASALEYLHSQSLCLLDLKPDNILLSLLISRALFEGLGPLTLPIVKLADFGSVMHTGYLEKPQNPPKYLRSRYTEGMTKGFGAVETFFLFCELDCRTRKALSTAASPYQGMNIAGKKAEPYAATPIRPQKSTASLKGRRINGEVSGANRSAGGCGGSGGSGVGCGGSGGSSGGGSGGGGGGSAQRPSQRTFASHKGRQISGSEVRGTNCSPGGCGGSGGGGGGGGGGAAQRPSQSPSASPPSATAPGLITYHTRDYDDFTLGLILVYLLTGQYLFYPQPLPGETQAQYDRAFDERCEKLMTRFIQDMTQRKVEDMEFLRPAIEACGGDDLLVQLLLGLLSFNVNKRWTASDAKAAAQTWVERTPFPPGSCVWEGEEARVKGEDVPFSMLHAYGEEGREDVERAFEAMGAKVGKHFVKSFLLRRQGSGGAALAQSRPATTDPAATGAAPGSKAPASKVQGGVEVFSYKTTVGPEHRADFAKWVNKYRAERRAGAQREREAMEGLAVNPEKLTTSQAAGIQRSKTYAEALRCTPTARLPLSIVDPKWPPPLESLSSVRPPKSDCDTSSVGGRSAGGGKLSPCHSRERGGGGSGVRGSRWGASGGLPRSGSSGDILFMCGDIEQGEVKVSSSNKFL